ncbi:MAG: haloacid dehalogenase type II [Candidatus Krumholzibacteriia bacterium]
MLDFDRFEVLTFDCYGTLVDWESGILGAVWPVLRAHGLELADGAVLERYARLERQAEAGVYRSYREVLRTVVDALATGLGFTPSDPERLSLERSFPDWEPFPDTVEALRALGTRYALAVISNVDNDLFAITAGKLQVEFHHVITAEDSRAYKPSLDAFRNALERLAVPEDRILHVAQSLHHDIVPAKRLGLSTVWVNRRHDREGFGATPAAQAQPDLEVPNLGELASRMGL